MIVARIASRQGDQLSLRIKSDNIPRLTIKLSDAERIGMRSNDHFLAAEGDEIILKGKLYRPGPRLRMPFGPYIGQRHFRIRRADQTCRACRQRRQRATLRKM